MSQIPSIDLHPEKIPGGADQAVRACRAFLDKALAAGHRQVRVITGLGLHGDGTPRLRHRVEQQVLGGLYERIEQTAYEQGGAVIKIWFKPSTPQPSLSWHRSRRHEAERLAVADREERLMVAWDRLDAAENAFEEGDLRRCRLKLNQIAREFGWPLVEPALDEGIAAGMLDAHHVRLKALDP